MDRVVVVGASLAGMRAAHAVRAHGFEGELTVVGEERHAPYTRPPLSKELLLGSQTVSECSFPEREVGIDWRLGVEAVGVDRERKAVQLEDGSTVDYDRLIIATGVRSRPWPGAGGELAGVHMLRTVEDAAALGAELSAGRRLLIVGAGFIGCEVAATARRLGVEVTMVAIDPRPVMPLGSTLGRWCEALHRSHGVDVRCGTEVVALKGDEAVREVELGDGTSVPADAVLIAIGAIPNTEWLRGSGLDLDPGVVCGASLTTADPDVLAAGDVASLPDPHRPGSQRRVEHWTVAGELGLLAGRNVLVEPDERAWFESLPYVWSDQYDAKIQAIGAPADADHFEVVESAQNRRRFVALGLREEEAVAAVAVNASKRFAWYRRQLATLPSADAIRDRVAADDAALGPPLEIAA